MISAGPPPRGQQRGLVDGVGQVGAGKAGRRLGDLAQIDAVGQGFAAAVDFQDRLPAILVGRVDHHLAVEAAGPQEGLVQDLGTVGGGQENHAHVGLEAVHLDQELVEGLLALVVDRPQMHAPLAADGVQFVDEDDAGGLLLGLLEQVADPRRPHAHEHLHELAAAQREEGHLGLAGHRAGEQRLPGAGQSHQQHALGNLGAQGDVTVGILEKIDDLLQLVLGLVAAGHILEGDARVAVGHQPGPALAEAHHRLPGGPQPARQKDP